MFRLTIEAATADELRAKITDAQPKGGSPLAVFTDEVLLTELRTRMRSQGLVVNVVRFVEEGEETSGEVLPPEHPAKAKPTTSATKRTRKETQAEQPAAPATEPAPVQEPAKQIMPETETAKAMAAAPASKEDVIKALDAHAAAHGGPARARTIMGKIGQGPRLADVPEDKWGELVAELNGDKAPEKAAA